MAEYKNIINNKVVISGEAELEKQRKELIAARDEVNRLNAVLSNTQEELERVRGEFKNFAHDNGVDILQEELERFRATSQQAAMEFRAFLSSVNLGDLDGYNDWQFLELFEQIKDGSITASQAILRVKTEFGHLMEENYNKSGGLFDTQTIQQFTASIENLGTTVNTILQKINTIEQEGVKAVGGSGGGDFPSVINQIENAARGMNEEVKNSYSSITNLVGAMNDYANLDSTKLIAVSQAFRNIADIGKGKYGTKSIENIIHLAKQLQEIGDGATTIKFDFTGLNELKVSKTSMENLSTYLPQIANVNMGKLEKLSKINFTNLNEIKVSKSSIENIARLAEALQGLKDAGLVSAKANDSSINVDSGNNGTDVASRYKDAAKAIKDYYSLLSRLDKTNNDISLEKEGWASSSGDWNELANALNKAKTAFDLYTNEENQSNLSDKEKVKILQTLTAESQKYILSVEARANKEHQAAENVGKYSIDELKAKLTQARNLLTKNTSYSELASAQQLNDAVSALSTYLDDVEREAAKAGQSIDGMSVSLKNADNGTNVLTNVTSAMINFREEMSRTDAAQEVLTRGSEKYSVTLAKLNKFLTQLKANSQKWSSAKNGQSGIEYSNYIKQIAATETLINEIGNGKLTSQDVDTRFASIKSAAADSEKAIKAAGEATQSWWQRVGKLTEKFNTWFGLTRIIMGAYRAVRMMVTSVIELDAAMTELKKVTDETDERYDRFLSNATSRAQKLGATLVDVTGATADFARLGYTLDDAEKLADAALLYKNVGDGISDINTASESIIATMQAFGVSAEDAISIVDKFNAVGNNYAISSKGVGDALLRSAAAMQAANNTLDETIALVAAANTIIQDPDKVGTTLKTISMFLRAAKTEAEEAGESTEGMADSVSELRSEILSLTGGKVDIQIDENTFKSTYKIIKELSGVWGELTDVSQANILELVGGKRNSNVVAALLNNFSIAEKAAVTSAESQGSALAENEKYLDSINGKILLLKAAFQALSQDTVNSDFVKFILDVATGITNWLDGLQKIGLLLPSIIGAFTAINLGKKDVGRPKMFGLMNMPTAISVLVDTQVFLSPNMRYTYL